MRNWLIQLRKEKGLSQTQVAAKASISQNYYSCIENYDRNPRICVAKRIAAVLDFPWTRLFETEL